VLDLPPSSSTGTHGNILICQYYKVVTLVYYNQDEWVSGLCTLSSNLKEYKILAGGHSSETWRAPYQTLYQNLNSGSVIICSYIMKWCHKIMSGEELIFCSMHMWKKGFFLFKT
jgi:hypothetical protein